MRDVIVKENEFRDDPNAKERQSGVGCCIGLFVVFSVLFLAGVSLLFGQVEPPQGNKVQLGKLREGAPAWNKWRTAHPEIIVDLDGFDFSDGNLRGVKLHSASIRRCDMLRVDLTGSSLVKASAGFSDLKEANLSGTDAREAEFRFADLSHSDLSGCNLTRASFDTAILRGANLSRTDLSGANLMFADMEDVNGWREIKEIRCANIYGVVAPSGFREWALKQGAMEYDRDAFQDWLVTRDVCLEN